MGEDLFIFSLRQVREQISDSELQKQISAFIGQEAFHSREHAKYNQLMKRWGYDIDAMDRSMNRITGRLRRFLRPMQALAVTMRGLVLREISLRHWPKVVFKEVNVGLMNGLAVAATTAGLRGNTTVAFRYDIAIGDRFLFTPYRPGRTILAQLGTDLTNLDASATLSGETTYVSTIELILNDAASDGNLNSCAVIHFGDHALLSMAP